MNWRTDKPTADVIVTKVEDRGFKIMYASNAETDYYLDDNGEEFSYTEFVKWADLEEDETVTNCHQLEEEVKKYITDNWEGGHPHENAPLYLYDFSDKDLLDAARHFAEWGAEHIADDSKKASGDSINSNDLEEAAKRFAIWYDMGTSDEIARECFKAGANWQKEQDKINQQ